MISPSLFRGIFPPTAHKIQRTSKCRQRLTGNEHIQGLLTLFEFLILWFLKPYFMLKMPMGFTSQSFFPGIKAVILTDFSAPLPFIVRTSKISPRGNKKEADSQASKPCSLKPSSTQMKVINFHFKPHALSGFSSLRYWSWTMKPASRFLHFHG